MNNIKSIPIKLKYIFYFEGIINIATMILCIFFPRFFLNQFVENTNELLALEITRWYGILLFVITFILIGSLILGNNELVKIVLLGYLIGDFAQIAATIYLAVIINNWSFAILFTLIITLILIIFRIIVLIKPQLLGLKPIMKKKEIENIEEK